MSRYLASQICIGGQCIQDQLPAEFNSLSSIVNKVVGYLIPIAGIILLFVLIWGGYDYLMSQGNPEKIKSAQAKMTTGIIGFILLVVSFLIVKVITIILGIGEGIV